MHGGVRISTYALLLSSASISQTEWLDFLHMAGAEVIDKLHNPCEGRIVRGHDKIWLGMDDGQLEDIDARDLGLVGRLGAEPRTLIVIEMAKTPGSRARAEEIARRFSERWPAVLEDVRDEAP